MLTEPRRGCSRERGRAGSPMTCGTAFAGGPRDGMFRDLAGPPDAARRDGRAVDLHRLSRTGVRWLPSSARGVLPLPNDDARVRRRTERDRGPRGLGPGSADRGGCPGPGALGSGARALLEGLNPHTERGHRQTALGAGEGNRTPDLLITSEPLCRLSYPGDVRPALYSPKRSSVDGPAVERT